MRNSGSGRLAKLIGGLTIVLGGALVVMAFFPVKQLLSGENDWLDYLFTVVFVPVMVAWGFHRLAVKWLTASSPSPSTPAP